MKRSTTAFVLLTLLALFPSVQALTATPLATPMATVCVTNADCPSGKLCCYPCGIDGCSKMCLTPIKGRCPLFV